jgi:hypothetical protein
VGVHFAGRYGEEATLLALAAELERAQPWFDRVPALSCAQHELARASARDSGLSVRTRLLPLCVKSTAGRDVLQQLKLHRPCPDACRTTASPRSCRSMLQFMEFNSDRSL